MCSTFSRLWCLIFHSLRQLSIKTKLLNFKSTGISSTKKFSPKTEEKASPKLSKKRFIELGAMAVLKLVATVRLDNTRSRSLNGHFLFLKHVYMIPEVNSNLFEMSNRFEMSFRLNDSLHGDFTAATFQTIARLYCTCANDCACANDIF